MKNISEHITYKEATRSNKARAFGMKNKPNKKQLAKMIIDGDIQCGITLSIIARLGLGRLAE